jgi:hypothetical protein
MAMTTTMPNSHTLVRPVTIQHRWKNYSTEMIPSLERRNRGPTVMRKVSYTTASMQIHQSAIRTGYATFLVRRTKKSASTSHPFMRMEGPLLMKTTNPWFASLYP